MVAMRGMFHHYDIKAKTLRIKTEVTSKWHISAVAISCNITFLRLRTSCRHALALIRQTSTQSCHISIKQAGKK